MENEKVQSEPVEVECPKCKHRFFHKVGEAIKHALGTVAEVAVEVGLEVTTGGLPGQEH